MGILYFMVERGDIIESQNTRRQCLQIQRVYKRGLRVHAKKGHYEWPLHVLCPLNALFMPLYGLCSLKLPVQEALNGNEKSEERKIEKKVMKKKKGETLNQ